MTREDERLRDRIAAALKASPQLDATAVHVDAADGVVLIRGTVRTHAERLAARTIAREDPGAQVVDDRIEVRMRTTRRDLDDAAVTANVRAALEATGIPLTAVQAIARQHVVTLSGHVGSEELRARLHQAALDAEGVDMVENRIRVDPDRTEEDRGGEVLGEQECWRLLRRRDVGRLAVRRGTGVDIFPVNYRCGPDSIYFRSAPGTKLATIDEHPEVAFEVDGGRGDTRWSVVVRGVAHRLADERDIRDSGADRIRTFDPREKHDFVRIDATSITGRRFHRG